MKVICDLSVTSAPMWSRTWTPAALFAGGAQGTWYDPSDPTTLFQDVDGNIPVEAVGDPVARVLDKSGNGNHATVGISAARPVFGRENGLYHLTFDGVDDFLRTSEAVDLTTKPDIVISAGIRRESTSGTSNIMGQWASAPNSFGLRPNVSVGEKAGFVLGGMGEYHDVLSAGSYSAPFSSVTTGSGRISLPGRSIRVNGQETSNQSGSTAMGFQNAPLFVGASGTSGNALAHYFHGR